MRQATSLDTSYSGMFFLTSLFFMCSNVCLSLGHLGAVNSVILLGASLLQRFGCFLWKIALHEPPDMGRHVMTSLMPPTALNKGSKLFELAHSILFALSPNPHFPTLLRTKLVIRCLAPSSLMQAHMASKQ